MLTHPISRRKPPNIGKTPVNRPLCEKLSPCILRARMIMAFRFSKAGLLLKYHHSLSVRRMMPPGRVMRPSSRMSFGQAAAGRKLMKRALTRSKDLSGNSSGFCISITRKLTLSLSDGLLGVDTASLLCSCSSFAFLDKGYQLLFLLSTIREDLKALFIFLSSFPAMLSFVAYLCIAVLPISAITGDTSVRILL